MKPRKSTALVVVPKRNCDRHLYAVNATTQQVAFTCCRCGFEIRWTFADPPNYWGVPGAYGAKNWLQPKEQQ